MTVFTRRLLTENLNQSWQKNKKIIGPSMTETRMTAGSYGWEEEVSEIHRARNDGKTYLFSLSGGLRENADPVAAA